MMKSWDAVLSVEKNHEDLDDKDWQVYAQGKCMHLIMRGTSVNDATATLKSTTEQRLRMLRSHLLGTSCL